MELKAQRRGDILVRRLFVRQHDIEPDRLLSGIGCAAVGRFHDRRAATGADYEIALAVGGQAAGAGQTRQFAGFVIIFGLLLQSLRDPARFVVNRRLDQRIGLARLRYAGRSVHDQRRADAGFVEQHLRLEQLQLEADRAQLFPKQELGVLKGEPIGRITGLGGADVCLFGKFGFLLGAVKTAVMEIFVGHAVALKQRSGTDQTRCSPIGNIRFRSCPDENDRDGPRCNWD